MKKYIYKTILITLLVNCSKHNVLDVDRNIDKNNDNTVNSINEEPTKPLTELQPTDELIIIVRADGAPGMYLNEQNEPAGFYVDLEKLIMKEMNQKFRFISYTDLGKAIQLIKAGEIHSALATPDVPDFRLLTNISTTFEKLNFVIFLPSNTSEIVPENKLDAIRFLYGKRVGVQTRGHIYQLLRDHPEIELLEYPTTTIAMEALNRGEVDAVPEVNIVGNYYINSNNWQLKAFGPSIFELNIGTGFTKNLSQDFLYRYNKTLQKLIDNGTVEAMYQTYFKEE